MKSIERFFQYIEYKGIKHTRFEKDFKLSNGYLGTQLKRKGDLGETILNQIIDNCLDLNPDWLLTGKGSMLRTQNEDKIESGVKALIVSGTKGVPFVTVRAVGGFGSESFSISNMDVKEYYVIPKFNHKKVDFMIEVEGSSMYPKYSSGDVVACTILREASFLQWNKTHVVATMDQGILIKRIQEGSSTDNLLMISDNDSYKPFEVPRSQITGIALVVGVIRME